MTIQPQKNYLGRSPSPSSTPDSKTDEQPRTKFELKTSLNHQKAKSWKNEDSLTMYLST